jgi:2-succinyl-6-hydroxy-2,4-cyclohexadiene-1-carboxylate synthase
VGAATDWHRFRHAWEQAGYECRAVDLWRFLDCCPRSLGDTALALNAEVSAHSGKNLLVGYSMGGRIALHALLCPKAPWDRAVIIGAHPGLETEQEKSERRKKDADWAASCHRDSWNDFLEEWQAQPVLQMPSEPKDICMDRGPLHLRRKEIARSFLEWSLGVQDNLWPRLEEIQIPLLWMTGESDAKFGALARSACERIPQARAVVIPGAGHRVPWHQPERFSQEVLAFFSDS